MITNFKMVLYTQKICVKYRKFNRIFILFLIFLNTANCKVTSEKKVNLNENMNKNIENNQNNVVYTGQIVKKEFIKKNGEPSGFYELYFRASVQDYFIKFCESKVSKNEISAFLAKDEMDIPKGVKVNARIIYMGYWDICNEDPAMTQSRVGDYIIIDEILNNK